MFGRRSVQLEASDSADGQQRRKDERAETLFVQMLNRLFQAWGKAIARHPWLFIGVSLLLTLFCTVRIPFTQMTNDVADFTPYGARARKEIHTYEAFFSGKGDPVVLFVLITAKRPEGNMLGVHELEEAVELLNIISDRFKVFDSATGRNVSFSEFCDNFCIINEPVRHFHSGLLLERSFGNSSLEHIDLGYPVTTVLGRQLHMDPHFFGVKIAVKNAANNGSSVVSVNELRGAANVDSAYQFHKVQLPNNIREIKLVGLHFRAVRPAGVSKADMQQWQRDIAHFVRHEFHGNAVDALVLSETLLTDEVVRAGLTLLPFLVIGFFIMVTFSSLTMSAAAYYMGQMGPHKVLLAVVACSCPFMACGTALGGMFWLGFRFGSLLCVTPFLTLALGVDDAYLMLNSWQRLLKKLEIREKSGKSVAPDHSDSKQSAVEQLMADVMVETGASITITTLTNVLAFAIGATTPTPEIQLFSIGNAVAITVVYIYQWTVFGSAMALFGSRELRSLHPSPELTAASVEGGGLSHEFGASMGTTTGANGDDDSASSNNSEADSGINVRGGEGDGSLTSVSRTSSKSSGTRRTGFSRRARRSVQRCCVRFLRFYCQALTNVWVSLGVLSLLAAYIYISIYGLLNIRAELKPEQLFLHSSDVQRILQLRDQYIMPFYAVCLVFVNRPGNFSDPVQRQKLHSLVADFEALPSSVGPYSTKFWLRDYEQFVEAESADEAAPLDDLATFEGISLAERHKNELAEFLQWPEFKFWNGFIQLEPTTANNSSTAAADEEGGEEGPGLPAEPQLSRFFFSTASFGVELKEWSRRELLLGQWRRVADSYPELEVSVYEDEAKFLDLIPTMIPQTLQSTLCTLFCMFLVCLLFMTNAGSLLVSNFAIFSTCIGVFGIQSLMDTALDPIFMSAAIMSIGFSVDIPAHIAYHFYKTGVRSSDSNTGDEKPSSGREHRNGVDRRLQECLSAIAFPVLEAGLSTLICVSSLFFVDLHMARVFAYTMTLVVAIGLVHGLLVIPVLLCQLSTFWPSSTSDGTKELTLTSTTSTSDNNKMPIKASTAATEQRLEKKSSGRSANNKVLPIVLAVNQQDKF